MHTTRAQGWAALSRLHDLGKSRDRSGLPESSSAGPAKVQVPRARRRRVQTAAQRSLVKPSTQLIKYSPGAQSYARCVLKPRGRKLGSRLIAGAEDTDNARPHSSTLPSQLEPEPNGAEPGPSEAAGSTGEGDSVASGRMELTLFPWFGSKRKEHHAAASRWKRAGVTEVEVDHTFSMWDATSPIGWYRYRRQLSDPAPVGMLTAVMKAGLVAAWAGLGAAAAWGGAGAALAKLLAPALAALHLAEFALKFRALREHARRSAAPGGVARTMAAHLAETLVFGVLHWGPLLRRRGAGSPAREAQGAGRGGGQAAACREFVAHAVSGGLLTVYLRLLKDGAAGSVASRVSLRECPGRVRSTLVMDSTPVLPSPANLSKVLLCYMWGVQEEAQVPRGGVAGAAWRLMLAGVRTSLDLLMRAAVALLVLHHATLVPLRNLLAGPGGWAKGMSRWERFGVAVILRGQWQRLGRHLLRTVVHAGWDRLVVLNNPQDPFLASMDLQELQRQLADLERGGAAARPEVRVVESSARHAGHVFALARGELAALVEPAGGRLPGAPPPPPAHGPGGPRPRPGWPLLGTPADLLQRAQGGPGFSRAELYQLEDHITALRQRQRERQAASAAAQAAALAAAKEAAEAAQSAGSRGRPDEDCDSPTVNIQTFGDVDTSRIAAIMASDRYVFGSDCVEKPAAIMVQDAALREEAVTGSVLCIARCGTDTSKLPVQRMTELGIPVFNTPGAHAAAVTELAVAALLLASRGVIQGYAHFKGRIAVECAGDARGMADRIDAEKDQFAGQELRGRTLGCVGLGAVGSRVVQAALELGMHVVGLDPTLSLEDAWRLPGDRMTRVDTLQELVKEADYLSLNVPYTAENHHLLDGAMLDRCKPGVHLINLAHEGLVDGAALQARWASGALTGTYISDSADPALMREERHIVLPHLGGATAEAQELSTTMAADTIQLYIETGSIKNSVNFPDVELPPLPGSRYVRLCIVNDNSPGVLGEITTFLGDQGINIGQQLNVSRGPVAYTVIDIEGLPSDPEALQAELVAACKGIISSRFIGHPELGSLADLPRTLFYVSRDNWTHYRGDKLTVDKIAIATLYRKV